MAKKRVDAPRDERPAEPEPEKQGQHFHHLDGEVRRIAFGLAVCGAILVLLKLAGM